MTTPQPPTDPHATDDRLPGEAELAALYRQLPQNEPGPALDAAVLQAAAQALGSSKNKLSTERRRGRRERGDRVHARHAPLRDSGSAGLQTGPRSRVPHWALALGSAASLVLVAGLAWQMRGMPSADTSASAQRAALTPRPVSGDTAIATAKSDQPAPPPEATKPQPQRAAIAPASIDEAAEPAPMTSRQMGNMTPPAPLPPGMKVLSGRAPFVLTERQTTAADAAQRTAAREAVIQKRAASVAKQSAADHALTTGLTAAALQQAAPAPSAALAESASNDSTPAAYPANPADSPEQELVKIQQLVQQQRGAEASKRLQAFHQAHPQWKLPTDLRALLLEP